MPVLVRRRRTSWRRRCNPAIRRGTLRRTCETLGLMAALALGAMPAAVADPAGKTAICHATGSADHPYVSASVSLNGIGGHEHHNGDIIPPNDALPAGMNFDAAGEAILANGCVPLAGQGQPEKDQERVEICHATGSDENPFVRISISISGLHGHGEHAGDIIPPNNFLPAGLNFDAAGEATFHNGCVAVREPEQSLEDSGSAPAIPEQGSQLALGASAPGEASHAAPGPAVSVHGVQHGQRTQAAAGGLEQSSTPLEQSSAPVGATNLGFNVQTAAAEPAPVKWGLIPAALIAVLWEFHGNAATS